MDIRRLKLIVAFLLVITIVASICFIIFKAIEEPRMRDSITADILTAKGITMGVVVANKNIMPEQIITDEMITYAERIVLTDDSSNYTLDGSEVVGKIAKTKIYEGEPIVLGRLETVPPASCWYTNGSEKYYISNGDGVYNKDERVFYVTPRNHIKADVREVTFDVPAYGFVNGNVVEGSYVDLMLDRGDNQYGQPILSNICIYQIRDIVDSEQWQSLPNEAKKDDEGNSSTLTEGQKLANIQTHDKRVTIFATQEDQEKIYSMRKEGKFFFRLHVSERSDDTISEDIYNEAPDKDKLKTTY